MFTKPLIHLKAFHGVAGRIKALSSVAAAPVNNATAALLSIPNSFQAKQVHSGNDSDIEHSFNVIKEIQQSIAALQRQNARILAKMEERDK